MTEVKLEKRFPHIPDEDVTRIFQDGYMKGWENARKKAIPIEWIKNVWLKNPENQGEIDFFPPATFEVVMNWLIEDWEKENESNVSN